MRAPKRRRSVGADAQHVPPVGGGGMEQGSLDDLDFISRLPDEVLGTVVSLLRTKEGARTQVLSRRWRPLWRSPMAPLNLAADCTLSGDNARVAVVSKILSDHPGPARRFSLSFIRLDRFRVKAARWFRSGTLAGLEVLEVTNCLKTRYRLPPCTLTRFAPTLRLLMLSSCIFPGWMALPSFPHLKRLILVDVGISDDSLKCMISSCAVLESVSLRSVKFGRLCISSKTLRSINLWAHRSKGGELVIEDAPCLERLLPYFPQHGPAKIRVIRAPKLQILGFLSQGISIFHFGTTVFQKMIGVSLTTKMRTMKILALNSTGANLYAVVDFLKCFPCLEKLYVFLESLPKKDINVWLNYDPLDPIECLELHLQRVVLKNYEGNRRSFVDFVKFLILNAKVLKEMEIGVLNGESDQGMCYQRSQLQLENRASRDAQIQLRSDTHAIPTNHVYTKDLSIADPFESKVHWRTVFFG